MLYERLKIVFFLILVSIGITSCEEKVEYPIVPEIEFLAFYKLSTGLPFDYKGVLRFSFLDGDGDIGLNKEDMNSNLFISYFEKVDGVFLPVLPDTNNNTGQRIPWVTPEGVNKAIRGIVEDTITIPFFKLTSDTIRLSFYITDRAGHKSNEVLTPEIYVRRGN